MRGLTRSMQTMPAVAVVVSLVLIGAVEGQQQSPASPARVPWAADRKVGLIERQQQQPSHAPPVREAGVASRIHSEPTKNIIAGSEHLPWGPRRPGTPAAAPVGEARAATRNGRVAGSTFTVELAGLAPLAPIFPASAPERGRSGEPPSHRGLQEADGSCEVGGAFTISSTVYRAANGCYFAFVEEDPYWFVSTTGLAVTVGDRLVMPFSSLVGTSAVSSDFPDFWLMAEVYEVSSTGILLSIECESYDIFVEGSHPSDVSAWSCYIAGSFQDVTAETFGITCGCGGVDIGNGTTPAPAGAVAPTPVDADSPAGLSGCGGTDPFAIVSAQLAELDGCYQDTGGADDGDTFFSTSGEKEDGVLAVYPAPFDEQAFDFRWIVGTFYTDTANTTVTCISDEAPSDAHPSDATFFCDLTGTGAFTTVTNDQFDIVCGCNGTTAATVDDGTMAPTTTPARGIDLNPTTPSPAAPELGVPIVVSGTPSPAGTEEELTIADDADGAGPRAWLSTAAAAAAISAAAAVLMGVP